MSELVKLLEQWGRETRAVDRISRAVLSVCLIAIGIAMFLPVLWVISNALLPERLAYSLPPDWLPTHITTTNFRAVFDAIPFGVQLLNSLKIATLVTVGAIGTSVAAAYAFARLTFPGRDFLFVVLLAALMIPQQVTVIPVFVLMRWLGLIDTHAAIILPGLVNVLGIFLLRQYFLTIPRSLDEAARMDGAGNVRILWQIILPLSLPAISALGIYVFQFYWNDFYWPNIFLNTPGRMTLPVGLVSLQGLYGSSPAVVVFAAIAMIAIPVLVLFVFSQRTLTESIALTGLRR
jgi:multiple sugar transport system permease protein